MGNDKTKIGKDSGVDNPKPKVDRALCKHNFSILRSDMIIGNEVRLTHTQMVECQLCGETRIAEFEEPYKTVKIGEVNPR